MEPQTDRLMELEARVELLNLAGKYNSLGGLETCNNVDANKAAIALNTATIESFERTFADMQAQIDELMAGEAPDA